MELFFEFLSLFGYFSIGVVLFLLARLSRRLGEVTHAQPRHIGLYVAAGLVWTSTIVRLIFILNGLARSPEVGQNLAYVLFTDGIFALGITIGLFIAWHYWSWLLAERD